MAYRYNPFTADLDLVLGPGDGNASTTFATDSGTATPTVGGQITISGGTGLSTSGASSTVTVTLDTPVTVPNGGTGATSLTDGGVILGSGTGAVTVLGQATDGQLVIGSTGIDPVLSTLTAGTGVTITNAAGSITVGLTGGGVGIDSFSPDSGTDPVVPDGAGLVTVIGSGSTTTVGGANQLTVQLTGLTANNVLIGAGTTTITKVAPSATTGIALVSQGAAADPAFSTVVVGGGGTGSTSFTAGSVIFSNGTILTEDNSNLFWDDTNNRLGIGTTTPLDDLHIVGAMDLVHTSIEADDHALEIDCNAAGFGDVKAVDVNYVTGTLAAGDDEEVILVNIDESASTGGEISGYQVLTTAEGSATIHGYVTGINVNPILHNSGTFGDIDNILNKAVDVTAALASGGAGNISVFVADNDTVTYGDAAKWNEMEMILDTAASGAGIAPTFEFSTGGSGFTAFVPSDGTNGLRNSGAILWIAADLSGWATNTSGLFEIRQTRTRNSLSTTPILDEVQLSSATEFIWDKTGDVNINTLEVGTDAIGETSATQICSIRKDANAATQAIVKNSTDGTAAAGKFIVQGNTCTGSLRALSPSHATASNAERFAVHADSGALGLNLTVDKSTADIKFYKTTTLLGNCTTDGEWTQPLQPAFLAYNSAIDNNVTGDGTVFTVEFNTEVYDQNADYSTSTDTFTAPVAGRYHFETFVFFAGLLATHTAVVIHVVASNRTFKMRNENNGFAGTRSYGMSTYMDMDALDTCIIQVDVQASTKVIDISGSDTTGGIPFTVFGGKLVC